MFETIQGRLKNVNTFIKLLLEQNNDLDFNEFIFNLMNYISSKKNLESQGVRNIQGRLENVENFSKLLPKQN